MSIRATLDMCSGTRCGTFNLMFNSGFLGMCARTSLYTASMFSFCGFNLYPASSGANDYLLNPFLAILQTRWQNIQNGFNIIPNYSSANISNYSVNPFNFMGGSYAPTFSSTTSSTSSTSKPKTDAEKADEERIKQENTDYQKKFNRIYKLLNEFAFYNYDGDDEYPTYKAELDKIKDNKDLTNKAKYEQLLAKYNEITKEDKEDFFINNQTIGIVSSDEIQQNLTYTGKDGKDKPNMNNMYINLYRIGYERNTHDDTEIYKPVVQILVGLNSGKEMNTDMLSALGSRHILDVLSSLNTELKKNNKNNPNTIKYLINLSKKDENIKKIVGPIIEGLKAALIEQAEEYTSKNSKLLSKIAKEQWDSLIANLSSLTYTDSSFETNFNTLYTYLRVITAKEVSLKMKNAFKDIDPEFFTEDLLLSKSTNNTYADLQAEGISTTMIEKAKNLGTKKGDSKVEERKNQELNFFAEKTPFNMTDTGIKLKSGGTTYFVYQNPTTKSYYSCVTDSKGTHLIKVGKTKDGKWTVSKPLDEKQLKTELANETKRISNAVLYGENEQTIKENADKLFAENGGIALMVKCGTKDEEWQTFKNAVDNEINSSNVLYIIKKSDKNAYKSYHRTGGDTVSLTFFTTLQEEWRPDSEKADIAIKMLGYIIEAGEKARQQLNDNSQSAKDIDKAIEELKLQITYIRSGNKLHYNHCVSIYDNCNKLIKLLEI